jgi:hypothetical protein
MSDFLNPHLQRPAIRWTSGDTLPAVEQTGPAAPLLVDASTGRLLVDTEANLSADLSDIESKQDVTNALLTTTAADVAAVKTQLATGSIAVTGGGGGGGGGSSSFSIPAFTAKTFTSSGGNITAINYFNGATQVAHRDLAYSSGVIISDTLSIP